MTILPLYAAPQYAPQVTDWLWHAFGGETLPREFFASIVQHSQTAEALPLTFIAVEGEQLLGTIGLWRCDLISRQDLFPWLAALLSSSCHYFGNALGPEYNAAHANHFHFGMRGQGFCF